MKEIYAIKKMGSDRDGNVTKIWYPLGLDMGIKMNFFYKDDYEIAKLVPIPLPSLIL